VRIGPWLGRFNYLGFALTDLITSQCTDISVELKEMLLLLYVLFCEILHHEAGKPSQEPIIRRVQLSHIPVTAFSQTDLFLFWIYRVFRPLQDPQWPNASTDLIFNWRRHFHREIKRKKAIFLLIDICTHEAERNWPILWEKKGLVRLLHSPGNGLLVKHRLHYYFMTVLWLLWTLLYDYSNEYFPNKIRVFSIAIAICFAR